jgi:hypothetical protein
MNVKEMLDTMLRMGFDFDMEIVMDTDSHNTAFLDSISFGISSSNSEYDDFYPVSYMGAKEWLVEYPEITEYLSGLDELDSIDFVRAFKKAYPEHKDLKDGFLKNKFLTLYDWLVQYPDILDELPVSFDNLTDRDWIKLYKAAYPDSKVVLYFCGS